MANEELSVIENNLSDVITELIYSNMEHSGLDISDEKLRDAIVSALEGVAAHFCAPEFGTSENLG